MNSTAKVLPLVDTDDHDVNAIVEAALHTAGFAVLTAIDGSKLVVERPSPIDRWFAEGVDLDPPTPTPPAPRR